MDAEVRAAERRFRSGGSPRAEADYARACARAGERTEGRPVVAFLERVETFAAGLRHPAIRAAALARVAWALGESGEIVRMLAVAEQAERAADASEGVAGYEAYRARARARIGACQERAGGAGQGAALIERALRDIATDLELDFEQHRQQVADAQKALESIIGSLADARAAGGRPTDDPLVTRVFEVIAEVPRPRQAMILSAAAREFARLGVAPRALGTVRSLIAEGQLPLLYLQDAAAALEVLLGDELPSRDDARRLVQTFIRDSEALEGAEHCLPMLKLALHGDPSAREVVEEVRHALVQRPYAAGLVTLAWLQSLAEQGERELGQQVLAAEITRLAGGGGVRPLERARLLVRLMAFVPAFGLGLEPLRRVLQLAEAERDIYIRNELMMAAGSAAAKLGGASAFDLVETLATRGIEAYLSAEGGEGGPRWLLFGTLEICADAAAQLGDPRGRALVARIARATRARAGSAPGTGAHEIGRFFFLKCLIACGHAAMVLGDGEAAEAAWSDVFAAIGDMQNHDLTELLERAAETAAQLQGTRRLELARRVVEAAARSRDEGSLFERFSVDLVATLTRGLSTELEPHMGERLATPR